MKIWLIFPFYPQLTRVKTVVMYISTNTPEVSACFYTIPHLHSVPQCSWKHCLWETFIEFNILVDFVFEKTYLSFGAIRAG